SEDNYTLIQPTAPVAADVTIDKAEPTINVTAAAYNKTYGDAPFVIVGVTPSTSLAAIGYEVTDGTDVISLTDTTVTILKTGTATITAYIPETINYTAASAVITVEVAKANSPKTKPQTEISVSESCTTVSDVGLPSGWEWADEDKDKTLAGGVPVTAAAKYTGTDAECYNNTTVSVTITRASHTHTAGAAVHENVTASTCTTGGSYDKIIRCTECNEIISRTHCTTAPLGHTLGDPVYENEVKATCTGAGSGETAYYCAVCGTIMVRTSAMQPALGHNYISVVTTPATCSTAGVKTYTCSRCSDTYTEVIPKLDHETTVISDNVTAATCTSSGSYDEINYCTRCEAEISRTRITVPALGHNFENSKCTRCGAIEVKPGTLADLLENATGDKLILALVADESVTKLKFPKNVKEITIDGGGHTLDFTGAANIKPNQELTLINMTIKAEKKGNKQNITLTAAAGGLVLEDVTFDGKKTTITASKGDLALDNVIANDLTVKGNVKTTLTVEGDVSAATVSGFGNIKADGSLTVTKTLKANTLELSGNAVLNVAAGAAITLSKGISGNGTINLASGFKAITLNGAAAGRIRLTGDKMTDGQLIFKSKLTNLNDVFDISGIAPEVTDGEYEYGLYAKSGKVYLRAFKMQLGDTAYCEWADIMTDITKAGKGDESYTVSLLGSVDLGKAFKLPTKGKYAGLTIDGNGNTLTYSGSSITLTGNLKLTNLTLNATAKNGCTIKQGSFTLDAGGAELVNCKVK
ncbi:MAG: hypothetical protein IJT87_09140, partial [Ruminiclostridium sp.]|nr:hypothetical protein [Ruminiclostridium sp.]